MAARASQDTGTVAQQPGRRGPGRPWAGEPQAFVYLPRHDDPQRDYVEKHARDRGLQSVQSMKNSRGYAGVVWVNQPKNFRRAWEVVARVSNQLDLRHTLANKAAFQNLFAGTTLIPEGFVVPPAGKEFTAPDGVWMWRPEHGSKGWNAAVVVVADGDQSALERQREFLATTSPSRRGVLTRYLTRPDLLSVGGAHFKFHMRVWLLAARAWSGALRLGFFRRAVLIRAKKPYVAGCYGDPDIHDTHTKGDYSLALDFPEDFRVAGAAAGAATADATVEALRELFARAFSRLDASIRPYSTSRGGFHLMGVDVMFEGGAPRIIEVNWSPLFPKLKRDNAAFTREVYDVCWGWAVDPLLGRGRARPSPSFVEVEAEAPASPRPLPGAAGR